MGNAIPTNQLRKVYYIEHANNEVMLESTSLTEIQQARDAFIDDGIAVSAIRYKEINVRLAV